MRLQFDSKLILKSKFGFQDVYQLNAPVSDMLIIFNEIIKPYVKQRTAEI